MSVAKSGLIPIEDFIGRVLRVRRRMRHLASNRAKSDKLNGQFASAYLEFPDDDAVAELIRCVFYASLESDEQRPTQLRLEWMHPAVGRLHVAMLKHALPLSAPSAIAKLSHAVSVGGAISLMIVDQKLVASALQMGARPSFESSPDRLLPGVQAIARAAGVIEYYEGQYSAAYARGKYRKMRRLRQIAHLAPVFVKCERSLRERLSTKLSETAASDAVVPGWHLVATALSVIVKEKHGGAIAIISGEPKNAAFKYDVSESSREWIINEHALSYAVARILNGEKEDEDTTHSMREKCWGPPKTRDMILQYCEGIGALAGVDGCVVVDYDLNVRGFGAVVGIDDSELIPIIDERSKSLSSKAILGLRGTRHRAALRLCSENPGSAVFVVSQDGDIRVFVNEGYVVRFIEDLTAE